MVKERQLPLPDWINPRHSLESRERYIWWIVPLWMLSSSTFAAVLYGMNVYILPITMHMFGEDANYTLQTGQVLYAFSISAFTATLSFYHTSKYMMEFGVARVYIAGTVLYVLSLVLGGLSNQFQSIWGFWLSVGGLIGPAMSMMYLPLAVPIVKWFREVGRPGLGSGIAGFCCGLWPAIFSFYCPLLIEKYGVTKSFYYNALITAISSIPAILFLSDPSEVPLDQKKTRKSSVALEETAREGGISSTSDFASQEQQEEEGTRQLEEGNTAVEPLQQPSPMKLKEIFATKQFYIQSIAILFSLLPGFAMKFNIAVFASAIFQADTSTQAIISFIYLFSYSLIRLVVGLLAGSSPIFSSSNIASISAGVQVPGFIAAGLVVWYGPQHLWAFVVFQTIVGMGLAAYKVTVSLNALARWGLQNFSTMFSLLFLAFGLAGTIGPFFGWIALSYQGDVPLKTLKADEVLDDHKQATEQTMSIFLYVMGGISMLGFVLNVFFCKNVVSNNENV